MLLPHQNEKELICNPQCAKEAFVAKRHLFNFFVPYEKCSFVEKNRNYDASYSNVGTRTRKQVG